MSRDVILKFDNVQLRGFVPISFELKSGDSAKIISCSNEDRDVFVSLLFGIRKPDSGGVFLFGEDIYSVSESEYIKIFKRIGVVLESGGLISNLKVGENIILPAIYHKRGELHDLEIRTKELFSMIGIPEERVKELMGRLPGTLLQYEKKIVGLFRAILMEPEMMIFISLFDGLSPELRSRLIRIINDFRKDRAILYMSSNPASFEDIFTEFSLDLSHKMEGTDGTL